MYNFATSDHGPTRNLDGTQSKKPTSEPFSTKTQGLEGSIKSKMENCSTNKLNFSWEVLGCGLEGDWFSSACAVDMSFRSINSTYFLSDVRMQFSVVRAFLAAAVRWPKCVKGKFLLGFHICFRLAHQTHFGGKYNAVKTSATVRDERCRARARWVAGILFFE